MTRDEILAMKPGRELDALVAEKVFGWEKWSFLRVNYVIHPRLVEQTCWPGSSWERGWVDDARDTDFDGRYLSDRPYLVPPHYSATIADAWEVVAELQRIRDGGPRIEVSITTDAGRVIVQAALEAWSAPIYAPETADELTGDSLNEVPALLCKAALLAVMEDKA